MTDPKHTEPSVVVTEADRAKPVAWAYDALVDNRFSRTVSLWNPDANIDAHNIRPLYERPPASQEDALLRAGDLMRDRLLAFVSALALETDCGPDVDAITAWDALLGRKTTGKLDFARAALTPATGGDHG